jgi:SPFH domain/Band 7 family protein
MISQLVDALRSLFGASLPWIVVPPWCVGVRVRLGKRATRLEPGFHFRIPLLDQIQLVNTRRRFASSNPVTVAGERPGHVRVRSAVCGFTVTDPLLAVLAFDHPEQALSAMLLSIASSCGDSAVAAGTLNAKLEGCGIRIDSIEYGEDVEVRALRIMNGNFYVWQSERGEKGAF